MNDADLTKVLPPKTLEKKYKEELFEIYFRKLASYRNNRLRFAEVEETLKEGAKNASEQRTKFGSVLDSWANSILKEVWVFVELDGGDRSSFGSHTECLALFKNALSLIDWQKHHCEI